MSTADVDEVKQTVRKQSYYMKRALDQRNIRVALQHAATMLGELRSTDLTPKQYYDVYIKITDELRHLEAFFASEQKRGRRMLELYELVQHAGNVLPRLYLLLCVGSVYIQSKEAAAKDILKDLVEMCRGVQHPLKGLFLRNYLSQTSKDKLPDTGSSFEGPGGYVADAINFVLSNFSEMNKLWVRMQHQGPVREREKRERERLELRILVGTNLVRLSQLEGMSLEVYRETVLPPVLEQVINCKDAIAQQYLMECLTHVFPLEFHIASLPVLLKHVDWLSAGADRKLIMLGLIERLSGHEAAEDEAEEASLFTALLAHVTAAASKADAPPVSVAHSLELNLALVRLAVKVYPGRVEYVDKVFAACSALLAKQQQLHHESVALVEELARQPFDHYENVLVTLQLGGLPALLGSLDHERQKQVAALAVRKFNSQRCVVDSEADVDKLFSLVAPLLKEDPAVAAAKDADEAEGASMDEDTVLELAPLSMMIQGLQHDNTDTKCRLLNSAYRHVGAGSLSLMPFTLVPLIFGCLGLARRIRGRVLAEEKVEVSPHKLLVFTAKIINALVSLAPTLAHRLYLQAAQTADAVGEEAVAYEFLTQSFIVYEEEIADSRAKLAAVTLATATLPHMGGFEKDHYEALSTQTVQHCAKLLKKPDQCRAVRAASYLFAGGGDFAYANPKRVLECLQRSLKIADACKVSGMHTQLFVEILDVYLWHFEHENELVTATYMNSLVQLVEQHLSDDAEAGACRARFQCTLKHIAERKASGKGRFESLEAPAARA